MFMEHRVQQAISRLRIAGPLPLRLQLWDGRRYDLCAKPTVTVDIPRRSALRYFISPDLNKLGEAFVEGHIRVEGSIHDIFKVAERVARTAGATTRAGFHSMLRHRPARDRAAIEYHYDVSNAFYSLFLDSNMVYSCAYYGAEEDSLDVAQLRKLDHILDKLMLKPGERFLDIGCGWGALAMRAARKYGAIATGITLSKNQFEHARALVRAAGLEDRCSIELRDYRDMSGAFDKIASVGMFEHVGLKNLPLYFAKVKSLLRDDGLVLNHGITTSDVESRWMGLGAGEFIDRYVFPDGELPHLSLVVRHMAAAGLEVSDVESLRRHYARTCREWADRLEANSARALTEVGEKRLRIWQVYLAGSAYAFSSGWMNLYQILAAKAREDGATPLPLTRDYLYPRPVPMPQ